jgi:hypothetical protein
MSAIARNCGGALPVAKILHVTAPAKTSYASGDKLNLSGMSVTVEYTDGNIEEVTDFSTSPANGAKLTKGTNIVNVNWTDEDGYTLTASFGITVKYVIDIFITSNAKHTVFDVGDFLNTNGLEVSAKYSDNSSKPIDINSLSFSPEEQAQLKLGDDEVRIYYECDDGEFAILYPISVALPTIAVTTLPKKTSYIEGEILDYTGIGITLQYNTGETEDISNSTSTSIYPYNETEVDKDKTDITVTYNDVFGNTMTTSFKITVASMTGIKVVSKPNITTYVKNQHVNTDGLVVYAEYDNGASKEITDYTTSPANGTELTDTTTVTEIVVNYTDSSGKTFSDSIPIEYNAVKQIMFNSVSIIDEIIYPGTKLDYEDYNIEIVGICYDGSSFTLSEDEYTLSPADGTKLTVDDKEIIATATLSGETFTVSYPITVAYDTAKWTSSTYSTIKKFLSSCDAGVYDIKSYWSVGDERSITFSSNTVGETVTGVVMDLDGTTSGGTKYHAIIGQKNCLKTTMAMTNYSDGTTYGGYLNSPVPTYLTGTYYKGITSSLKDMIILSDHICGFGGEDTTDIYDPIQLVRDYIILPSEMEVIGYNRYSSPNETLMCKQFEWYKTTANCIKTLGNSSTTKTVWTLRSPVLGSSTAYCAVDTSGMYTSYDASTKGGISPFFCI